MFTISLTVLFQELGLIRKPASFMTSICDERGQELLYAGTPITTVIKEDLGIGGVLGLLWFQRRLPAFAGKFLEMVLMVTADHGPAVSGAHNTIVCARAGKDLISSLVSGLLTIVSTCFLFFISLTLTNLRKLQQTFFLLPITLYILPTFLLTYTNFNLYTTTLSICLIFRCIAIASLACAESLLCTVKNNLFKFSRVTDLVERWMLPPDISATLMTVEWLRWNL